MRSLLDRDIDVLFARAVIAAAALMVIYSAVVLQRPIYVLFGLIIIPFCLLWLFLRKKRGIRNMEALSNKRTALLLGTLFFLTLTVSIVVFYTRVDIYSRPLSYFVLASIMAGLAALEVLYLPLKRNYVALVLVQILIIGFSIQLSQEFLFPNVIGVDPWVHQFIVDTLVRSGNIPITDYNYLPLFHTYVSIGSLVPGLDYKMSAAFTVGLMAIVLTPLTIFLIGRAMFSAKIGLMAALLVTVAPYHILFGIWIIPNTLACITIPLIFYILLRIRSEKRIVGLLLAFFLMISVLMTHTVTSMGLAILLFAVWFIYSFYGFLTRSKQLSPISSNLALLFSVSMFGWWTFVDNKTMFLVNTIQSGFRMGAAVTAPTVVASFVYTIPFVELASRYLGMFVFFSLSLVGCFYLMSKKARSLSKLSLATIGLIPLFLGSLSLAFGITDLETRWFYLAEMFLALPLALGILLISSNIRKKTLSVIAVFILIVPLVFFSIASPSGQIDNHSLFPNVGVRFAFTESELSGALFSSQKREGPISTDFDFANTVISYDLGYDRQSLVSLDQNLLDKEFNKTSLILIRSEIAEQPIRVFGLPYKLDYDPMRTISEPGFGFDKVYDTGSLAMFR